MYKNAVIESLMLKRDIALLHDEINALKSKLAEHDHDAQPNMEFVPIESPISSAETSPAPTPDPIPPPSPEPEPEPICEPHLNAIESTSTPFSATQTIFSPIPSKRCVSCGFAKSCLKCRTGV